MSRSIIQPDILERMVRAVEKVRQRLVRMKLTSFRRKDQVHLLDLIGVGLIGPHDLAKLPPKLADRLKELLENPEG